MSETKGRVVRLERINSEYRAKVRRVQTMFGRSRWYFTIEAQWLEMGSMARWTDRFHSKRYRSSEAAHKAADEALDRIADEGEPVL